MPDFTESYLGYLLAACSHKVSADFHQHLAEQGIPVITWRVLGSLQNGALTVNELVQKVLVKQSTLSKALTRMEANDLVRKTTNPEHRRQVYVELTARGKKKVTKLVETANQKEKSVFNTMPVKEQKKLKELLRQLLAN